MQEQAGRLVRAEERERAALACELHDDLAQGLTAALLHLQAAERARDLDAARSQVQTANALTVAAVARLKAVSHRLCPAQVELLGFIRAARVTVQRLADAAGVVWHVRVRGEEPAGDDATAPVALRLLQDAATNVVQHAHATDLWLRLRFLPDGRIGFVVADNGIGFDPAGVLATPPAACSVGLRAMVERAQLVGGSLRVRSRAGRGTVVRVLV